MLDEQPSIPRPVTESERDGGRSYAPRPADPPEDPDPSNRGGMMPSKLRRTQLTLKVKAYRSAVALAGLLVLLEALGAPRKL